MTRWLLVAAVLLLAGMGAAEVPPTPFIHNTTGNFWVNHTWEAAGFGWYLISGEDDGVFNGYNWTGSTWQSDTEIVTGLGDVGTHSTPTVFQKDSTWYLISGEDYGIFNGYNWTGSVWQSDAAIAGGLGDIGYYSTPMVFQKDSTWYLISGDDDGVFYGFNWTGSTWQSDTGIVTGLGGAGLDSSPTVFEKDSIWYLISGGGDGVFYGFNWTGSAWQGDTAIVTGLGDVGWDSSPNVFEKDGIWYLISGEGDGVFNGFNWTGSTWQGDTAIVTGLGDVGYCSMPTVFDVGRTVTDSYNVSVNSVWHNGTDTFYNNTYSAHAWQNITVYAWNSSGTGNLSVDSASQDTQIPNNPIIITNTADWSGDEGQTVYVDYDATDADSDTPTFSCNRTDLFTDFDTTTGKGNWTTGYIGAGTYYVDFGVSDGYASIDNYTMAITTTIYSPPFDPSNLENDIGTFWVNHTWITTSWHLIAGESDVVFNGFNWTSSTWQGDTGIVSGLVDAGERSAPTVFQKDGTWYLIAGNSSGGFSGYIFNWTSSTWQGDSGIVSGLVDVGYRASPTVFQKDGTWYLISGEELGTFIGYNWTGSTWQGDTGIVSGLVGVGYGSAPTVFQKGSIWYLIAGEHDGVFNGYNWTGSAWQSDADIVSGLGDVGERSEPTVFEKGSMWYLISGEFNGNFNGYNWTGSTWQGDTGIVSGLGGIGLYSSPIVFNIITTDSCNVSINGIWHNGTTNTYYNNTLSTWGDWSNITVYSFNNTHGLSSGYISEDVQLPYPIPAVPAGAGSTWDYYWVNHSWTEGGSYGLWCGDTDSYNVSINGTWHNGTTNTYYNNTGVSPHAWSNASIYAFNDTAGINETYIFQNVQMTNRAISITNASDWSGWAGVNVYVDYDATDPDGDTPTFTCNRTDLFTDFNTATGEGNWTAITGTYYVDFGVSDGWGSTDNYTMEIVVVDMWQTPINIAHTTGLYWVNHTWEAGSGGVIADSYNVSINDVWHNDTTNLYYTNMLIGVGNWSNITVYGYNGTYGLSDIDVTENVQLIAFYPPTPINLAHQHSDCSIIWTWAAGSGYVTDSYNVSITTTFCGEVTTDWYTTTSPTYTFIVTCDQILPTIEVYAWNSTHKVRSAVACAETITSLPCYDLWNEDFEIYAIGSQAGWTCEPGVGVQPGQFLGVDSGVGGDWLAYKRIPCASASDELYIYFNVWSNVEAWDGILYCVSTSPGSFSNTIFTVETAPLSSPPDVGAVRIKNSTGAMVVNIGSTSGGWHSIEVIYNRTAGTMDAEADGYVSGTYPTGKVNTDNLYLNMRITGADDGYGGIDNIYAYPIGTFGCYGCTVDCGSHHIVLYDEEKNLVQNAGIFIYDVTDGKYIQKWMQDDDGVISLLVSHYGGHTVQIGVNTFDGTFVQDVYIEPSGGVTNITIPIRYNLKVYPTDEHDAPLFNVFAGLAEYTPLNPGAFWGMDLSDRGVVPVSSCSGFAMCDIIAEKEGYADYKVEALNWTSKSALVKDYRHNIIMEEE